MFDNVPPFPSHPAQTRSLRTVLDATFIKGILCGAVMTVVIVLAVRYLPCLGLAYGEKPGFRSVRTGNSYADVLKILGPEDGTISSAELSSYHRNRFVPGTSGDNFAAVEQAGGRHRFWLSKFNCLLVFNVISFDHEDRVVSLYSGYDTYFGLD